MNEVLRQVRKAAASAANVLLLGETGTGKELAARAVHEGSERQRGPFVVVHGAALAGSVVESELFGHEKGAFTGATYRRIGPIEAAARGTLFFDEVGDLPLLLQEKLLRVIETRQVQRLGASAPIRVDFRMVAATHRDLESMVAQGTFRQDLYYRLTGIQIELPPLRSRMEDLELLLEEFLGESSEAAKKHIVRISPGVVERFRAYGWPGNLRQLRHCLDAMIAQDEDGELGADDIPANIRRTLDHPPVPRSPGKSIDVVLQRHVLSVLDENHWHFARTAEVLGINRETLRIWLRRWGIDKK